MRVLLVLMVAAAYGGWDNVPLSMNTQQAAKVIGIGINSLRQLIHDGRIEAIRIGPRKFVVTRQAVMDFLNVRGEDLRTGLSGRSADEGISVRSSDQGLPDVE